MKTVCLVEVSNGGHREAFMQLFAKALLETGNKVVCIMPDTTAVENWIVQNHPVYSNSIQYYTLTYPHDVITKHNKWQKVRRFIHIWNNYKKEFKKIEKQFNLSIDFVFWNCLDGFMCNYLPGFIVEFIFPFKWSGLYFHPNEFRATPIFLEKKATFRDIDSVFLAKNCKAVTIHDEGILEKYQKRINKKTILFPEIADATKPDPSQPLAVKIKEKANGRTIVGIIGLEPYKGTLALIRLVAKANPSNFFFAFTGAFEENYLISLSTTEKEEVKKFIQNLPENCLWQTGLLKEGEEYNSVFFSFDIVYLMYKKFYSSSNRLTKAAIFQKMVLGNNYGCVGDDIPRYNLGEVADEDDVEEQYQKLKLLNTRFSSRDFPFKQWEKYMAKHSTEILKDKFIELLKIE